MKMHIAIAAAAMLSATSVSNADTFKFKEASVMYSNGATLSTESSSVYAEGTLSLDNGMISQIFFLCTNEECSTISTNGSYTISGTNKITITDQYGSSAQLIVVNDDPLITHSFANGITEVDVWERVDPFTKNAGATTQSMALSLKADTQSQNMTISQGTFGTAVGSFMEINGLTGQ